jgi:hypothetical protein
MFSRNICYFILIIFFIAGCKKDKVNFPVEPGIEMVSITPSSPMQYTDPVTITIHYEDGDGDLGENNDQVKNCFVTDNRVGITYEYRIKQLAPSGAMIPIEGNLNIDIGGQVLTDSSSTQSANYTLYIIDRAGHKSNSVTTGTIQIIK